MLRWRLRRARTSSRTLRRDLRAPRDHAPSCAGARAGAASAMRSAEHLRPLSRARAGMPASLHASSRPVPRARRSEEHTSELQSHLNLVCRLLLEKKKKNKITFLIFKKKKKIKKN